MKKTCLKVILWFFVLIAVCVPGNLAKASAKKVVAVPLDKKHFPDSRFYANILRYDKNEDHILSEKEIRAAKKLSLDHSPSGDFKERDYVKKISLKGIEYLVCLKELYVDRYEMNRKNMRRCSGLDLERLTLIKTDMKEIDLSCFPHLKQVCIDEQKKTVRVDVTGNRQLETLRLGVDKVQSIDLSRNRELTDLNITAPRLKSLDLSKNKKLSGITLELKRMKKLDLSGQKEVSVLNLVTMPSLRTIDLSDSEVQFLCFRHMDMKKLNLSFLPVLRPYLYGLDFERCSNLKKIKLSGYRKLEQIECRKSDTQEVVVKGSPRLKEVYLEQSPIKKLSIGNRKKLKVLDVSSSRLEKIDLQQYPALERLYLGNNTRLQELKIPEQSLRSLDDLEYWGSNIKALDISDCTKAGISGDKETKRIYQYLGGLGGIPVEQILLSRDTDPGILTYIQERLGENQLITKPVEYIYA